MRLVSEKRGGSEQVCQIYSNNGWIFIIAVPDGSAVLQYPLAKKSELVLICVVFGRTIYGYCVVPSFRKSILVLFVASWWFHTVLFSIRRAFLFFFVGHL